MFSEDKVTEIHRMADDFCKEHVRKHLTHLFPRRVSHDRLVEPGKKMFLFPLAIFIRRILPGNCTGISLVDSTPRHVFRNQRMTFGGLQDVANAPWERFLGFKPRLIVNDKEKRCRNPCSFRGMRMTGIVRTGAVSERHRGKPCGGKRHIGQALYGNLFPDGLRSVDKNQGRHEKLHSREWVDKILPGKRGVD